jgi:hypothetical protein
MAVRDREIRRARPGWEHDAVVPEERLRVSRPRCGNRCRADAILENEVPSDDPCDRFAKRRVRVGIRAPRDRYHRREFRVAERDEHTCEAGQKKRPDDARTGNGGSGADRRKNAAEHRAEADANEAGPSEHAPECGAARRPFAIVRLACEESADQRVQAILVGGAGSCESSMTRGRRSSSARSRA